MTNDMNEDDRKDLQDKDLRRIAGMIASLPGREPPAEIIDSVMARIRPKKLGTLKALWRRMQVPLAIAPLRMA